MTRTTLDTAALAHDLRLAVMRFSRRLRNQRIVTHVGQIAAVQVDWDVNAVSVTTRSLVPSTR